MNSFGFYSSSFHYLLTFSLCWLVSGLKYTLPVLPRKLSLTNELEASFNCNFLEICPLYMSPLCVGVHFTDQK